MTTAAESSTRTYSKGDAWTAAGVAAAVRDGSRSAVDAVQESLDRIRRDDQVVGAFQIVREEKALAEAAAVDADRTRSVMPLAGVPIAVKDNVSVAGEPTRDGSLAWPDGVTAADHAVVARLRRVGAIVVGKTRVPELCIFAATDSAFGISRNPWNLSLTPGGSSGGSAAAVASAMVPLAHGNDGMGSVRIPSACAGLVGMKPGSGRVPQDLGPTNWYGMSENGMLATTVADLALGMTAISGDAGLARVTEPSFVKVAVSYRPPVQGVSADSAFKAGARTAGEVLASIGHDVEDHEVQYPTSAALNGLARWFTAVADDVDLLNADLLEPRTRTHAAIGRAIRPYRLHDAHYADAFRAYATEFLTTYDVLITPALARPPIESKAWGEGSWLATMKANVSYAPFAAPWNIIGFPAMVVPIGLHSQSGTPVAAQLVARPGREDLLLGVAATIERLRPWQRTAPGF
jgi:amidase